MVSAHNHTCTCGVVVGNWFYSSHIIHVLMWLLVVGNSCAWILNIFYHIVIAIILPRKGSTSSISQSLCAVTSFFTMSDHITTLTTDLLIHELNGVTNWQYL